MNTNHRGDMLDIIFANRNRAYGAYALRRDYDRTLARAFFFGIAFIGVSLLLPRAWSALAAVLPEEKNTEIVLSDLEFKMPEKPETPPPVPKTPPPPKQVKTVTFVPPVIKPDDQTPDEQPPIIDSLLATVAQIGTFTQDGEDPEPTFPDKDPGLGIVEPQQGDPDEGPLELSDVQKLPSFPGGEAEMMAFIRSQIKYPARAREDGIEGSVPVAFVIGKDGHLSDIQVLRTPPGGKELGEEAIRVVRSMPRWTPGEANGKPVKVRFTMPFKFRLE